MRAFVQRAKVRVAVAAIGIAALVTVVATAEFKTAEPGVLAEPRNESDGPGVYVDPQGIGGVCDDQGRGRRARSPETPICSLPLALAIARKGEDIIVREGTYPALAVTGDRTRARGITVRGYKDERPQFRSITIEGRRPVQLSRLTAAGSVVVGEGAANVTIRESTLKTGVKLDSGSRDIVIEANRIQSPVGTGVFFSSGSTRPPIVDVRIARNRFEEIGTVGVNARNFRRVLIEGNDMSGVRSHDGDVHPDVIRTYDGGRGLVIRGNRIHHNAAQGIFIKDGRVFDLTIENNEIVRNEGGFYGINIYDVDGLRIVNNTIADNRLGVVFQGDARRVELVNNILQSLGSTGKVDWRVNENNLVLSARGDQKTAEVRFESPGEMDYRLAPGSAGIDAGRER